MRLLKSISNEEIVAKLKAGDEEVFSQLYEGSYRMVYLHALKILKNEDESHTVAQDVFLTAYRSIDKLENCDALRSWLGGITVRKALHARRRLSSSYEIAVEDENVYDIIEESSIFDSPEVKYCDAETKQIIGELIDQLSPEQHTAVMLFYYDGCSVKEISEILDCSEGTVKSRLNYARKKIEKMILQKEEKEQIRLHSFSPAVLFAALLEQEESLPISIEFIREAFSALKVMLGITAAGTVVGAATGTGAAATAAGGAATAGGTAAAGGAAVTASGAGAAAGGAVATKAIAIVTAGTILVGGGAAVISHIDKDVPSDEIVEVIDYSKWVVDEIGMFSDDDLVVLRGYVEDWHKNYNFSSGIFIVDNADNGNDTYYMPHIEGNDATVDCTCPLCSKFDEVCSDAMFLWDGYGLFIVSGCNKHYVFIGNEVPVSFGEPSADETYSALVYDVQVSITQRPAPGVFFTCAPITRENYLVLCERIDTALKNVTLNKNDKISEFTILANEYSLPDTSVSTDYSQWLLDEAQIFTDDERSELLNCIIDWHQNYGFCFGVRTILRDEAYTMQGENGISDASSQHFGEIMLSSSYSTDCPKIANLSDIATIAISENGSLSSISCSNSYLSDILNYIFDDIEDSTTNAHDKLISFFEAIDMYLSEKKLTTLLLLNMRQE